jgi:hypothetical protein
MSYLDELRSYLAETDATEALTKPTKAGSVGIVGSPSEPISDLRAGAILREWHGHLSMLDDCAAPLGFMLNRWQLLCDDACWIYENFASGAVRNGWSANDLFGVLPWHPGWGGLCDRLAGARNLKMDQDRAAWSQFGVRDWTCRGAGDDLVSSGLVPIWELARA